MNDLQTSYTATPLSVKPSDPIQSSVASNAGVHTQVSTAPSSEPVVASSESVQQDLEKAVSRLNDYVQSTQRDLKFSMDEETGQTVITVTDRYTSEVIRQLPDQVVLDLAKKLNHEEPLKLFSAQA
ncbi:flagellar protein FlaG [uncultured Pseudoteredinibacter sp.]|uniref:flagellar protein FlaG n=1 Tax=uncultured Pseudoteredinibacter sp. TaxID=1641701 RepID=UPI0026289B6F|nr:flagellar protein FlaG [uncultured Pseudoteredinibacter sp.]